MILNEPLWTSAELALTKIATGGRPWYADGLHTNSKDILPGDIFVALTGSRADGHAYVKDAFDRGAVAAIVSKVPFGVKADDARLVRVTDTLKALQQMAQYAQERAPARLIGVTGSAGKTSVVQALRKSLGFSGGAHASIKSFNNHVGLPLSIARMPRSTQFGVFEMGMSAPGEIASRASLLKMDVAVITTVGAAHAGAFSSIEAIAREKASIMDGVRPGGTVVLGIDTPYADILQEEAARRALNVVTVSAEGAADVFVVNATHKYDCSCLTANINGTLVTYKVNQPGTEWVLNSLLVLACVQALEADLGATALALASLQAEPGRGRHHTLEVDSDGTALVIDDSYNANPLSMKAALSRLGLIPAASHGRKFALLADMTELGEATEAAHSALAGQILSAGVFKVFALGEHMAKMAENAGLIVERLQPGSTVADTVLGHLQSGDVLLVKGANSAGLSRVIDDMKTRCETHTQKRNPTKQYRFSE